MKIQRIINVSFTEEEQTALKTLKNIKCTDLSCKQCPFDSDNISKDDSAFKFTGCTLALLKHISERIERHE